MHPQFPLPDPGDELTRPFWAAAAAGHLAMPRCRRCRGLVWYPEPSCPACGSPAPAWEPVAGTGTLYTWTVVRHAFLPAFAAAVPFVAGLVALTEDPAVRLVTRIVGADPSDLAVDLPMEVTFGELRYEADGPAVTAPFFRPAAG
ncbi:MAG TPA: OB-fold domain-containing protein [Acidimicrobiales bacterium]|nr:OB-fold domain-containing protein [Acidimicrobiales bacterium]